MLQMISSAIKRILPFLNKHIPPEIAEKAINKISPHIGKFLKKGVQQGLPLAGGLNFIKQQFGSEEPEINQSLRPDERAAAKQQNREKNIGSTLKNVGKLGLTVAAAHPAGRALATGAEALGSMIPEQQEEMQPETNQPKQVPEIKAIEDKNAQIEKLWESAKQGKTQGVEFLKHASSLIKSGDIPDYETFSNFWKWWTAKPSPKRGTPRAEFELFRNEIGNTLQPGKAALQPQEMQQEQSPGQGQQALMAILQKIQQSRGQG